MSYQVLARKCRPSKFSEVIGQQHVVQALTNAMQTGRLHHAYLFTGTRGVGKTTLGRILAKSLNCENGPAAEPCGQCSCCLEIDQGRFVDLIEIDAASRTKVEDTREILDNVQYRPTRGRYKVYLIDEVHMLSRHSFNALLKTLEEPPPHVKFLLATTDPQKLPITILSRCLQFNLKAMNLEQIQGQLQSILQQEGISFEPLAIEQLSRAAQGSMRDALSLTDQAIAHGQGKLTDAQVTSMLGLLDRDHERALIKTLLQGDANQLMMTVAEVAGFAPDYDKLMASMQSLLHRASLTLLAPAAIAPAESESGLLQAIASHWAPEQIQLAYQSLVQARRDLPFAPDPRSGLEMALLRALMFRPMQARDLPIHEAPASAPVNTVQAQLIPESEAVTPVEECAAATVPSPQLPAEPEPEPELIVPVQPEAPAMVAGETVTQEDLIAQQQQILSMAESQGFQPQADEVTEPAPQQNEVPLEPVAADAPEQSQSVAPESQETAATGLDAILKTRNLLRSQLKQKGSNPTESAAPLKPKVAPKIPEPKPLAPVESEDVAKPQSESLPEPNPESIATPISAEPVSPAPVTVASDPQTPTDLPPWQSDELPDIAGYENMAPVAESDGYDTFQPVEPVPNSEQSEPETKAEPVTAEDVPVTPVFDPSIDISKPYQDRKEWWEKLIDTLGFDALKRQLALDCVLVPAGEGYQLQVPAKAKHLATENNLSLLQDKIRGYVGLSTAIDVVLQAEIETETPREALGRRSEERQQHAIATIHQDPVVKELQQTFDATIDQDTIKPS